MCPFSVDAVDKVTSAAQHVATVIALAVGGAWTYQRFIRQREGRSRIELTVSLEVIGRHPKGWIAQIVARAENKGQVRHKMKTVEFKLNGELDFGHKHRHGSFVPEDWDGTFIDAGVTQEYRYSVDLPLEASFAWVFAKFAYEDPKSDFHTATKVVAISEASVRARAAPGSP
jgi:hypothetical protein